MGVMIHNYEEWKTGQKIPRKYTYRELDELLDTDPIQLLSIAWEMTVEAGRANVEPI